jgi:hypothetical protein
MADFVVDGARPDCDRAAMMDSAVRQSARPADSGRIAAKDRKPGGRDWRRPVPPPPPSPSPSPPVSSWDRHPKRSGICPGPWPTRATPALASPRRRSARRRTGGGADGGARQTLPPGRVGSCASGDRPGGHRSAQWCGWPARQRARLGGWRRCSKQREPPHALQIRRTPNPCP